MRLGVDGRGMADADVQALVASIDADGFAVLKDFVPADDIARAQIAVETAVSANGSETVSVFGFDDFKDTFFHNLGKDQAFKALCGRIYETGIGRAAPESQLIPSLRCLSGRSAQNHSMVFHYDSYVLTAILPIIMPSEGKSGRLIVLPNMRRIRGSYLTNVVDKLFTDNKWAQTRFARLHSSNSAKLRYIDMKPGNLYLLWGYRSIHTNEAVDPDKIRSTAIFHYVDPHAGSGMKRLLSRRTAASRRPQVTAPLPG